MYRSIRSLPKALYMGAVLTALTASATAVLAEELPRGFIMTVYSNGVGGTQLVKGEYESALAEIGPRSWSRDLYPSMTSTNLCVAQAMTGRYAAARRACDAAVKETKAELSASSTWGIHGGKQKDYLAIAYANRAVLHYLSKDAERASADLAAARRLAPSADFVTRNIAALDSSGSIRRASAG